MVIKYKNKTYSSEDLPIVLFFKTVNKRGDFINDITTYVIPGKFVPIDSIDVILAGNTIIKDRRATTHIKFESIEERQALQKQVFNTPEDSNAIISTPGDIAPEILEQWISRYAEYMI